MEVKERKHLAALIPGNDLLSRCIHCGMCLSVCPTYELTKLETSSPRGRIKMMKSYAEGELRLTDAFKDEMYFCLDCQACETACPAGVKYGTMVEAARSEADQHNRGLPVLLKKFFLRYIVASPGKLKLFSKLLRFYQNSLLRSIIHKILPSSLRRLSEIDKLSPEVSQTFSDSVLPQFIPAAGKEKYKTSFLKGCFMNVMFSEINKDTVDLLTLTGSSVCIPGNQVCCGSLMAHNGDFETAKKLARKNIDSFKQDNYDFLISNSAGCSAFLKEYGEILKDDPLYAEDAAVFSSKVKDILEFLSGQDIEFARIDSAVTYHDACHHVHSQKIFSQPRSLLAKIPGLEVIPLEESTWCCGSAGIYNITRYDDSMKILDRKMKNIINTKSKIVLTANPGCISQLRYGVKRNGRDIKVIHPVSLLKSALSGNY